MINFDAIVDKEENFHGTAGERNYTDADVKRCMKEAIKQALPIILERCKYIRADGSTQWFTGEYGEQRSEWVETRSVHQKMAEIQAEFEKQLLA